MRNTVIAFVVLSIAFGCKKDRANTAFIGTWELRESFGGWTGIHKYSPGNGNLIIFDDKNQFTHKIVTADTSYTLHYRYSLVKENECGGNLVLQSKDNSGDQELQAIVSHDSLFISDGSCIADGASASYVKQ